MKEFDFAAWRLKAAKEYASTRRHETFCDSSYTATMNAMAGFEAGMATEAPVAELRGRIAALSDQVQIAMNLGDRKRQDCTAELMNDAEEKLARLLEKGEANG